MAHCSCVSPWIILAGILLKCVCGQNWEFTILEPDIDGNLLLSEGDEQFLSYNFTVYSSASTEIFATSTNTEVAALKQDVTHNIRGDVTATPNVTIRAMFLGRARVTFQVNRPLNGSELSTRGRGGNSSWYVLPVKVDVVVKRHAGLINQIFTGTVILLVCLANVALGCKTDVHLVKETLRTPIGPLTGLTSQFILMPLISFTVGYLLQLSPPMAFGLFAMGCAPGGAASNVYTYFLDGNVSLSVTMTFISIIASLAMIPLWLFTLGIHVIYRAETVTIPFINIVTSLLGLIIPIGVGIIIQKKKPSWAKFLLKLLRPVTAFFLIFVFTVGIYANLYIFKLMTPLNLLAGALLPYIGFCFGTLMAILTRRNKTDILTIAIETGIQNSGVAIVLLRLSLPFPDSDIAIVAPINCAIFTPLPLAIAIVIHLVRKRWRQKEVKDTKQEILNGNEAASDQRVTVTYQPKEDGGGDGQGGDGHGGELVHGGDGPVGELGQSGDGPGGELGQGGDGPGGELGQGGDGHALLQRQGSV